MKNRIRTSRAIFFIFILIIQFVLLFSVYSAAGDSNETISGFSTYELPDGDQEKIERNIDLKPVSQMNASFEVECFDVSDSDQLALGLRSGTNKYIFVFDKDGQFDCGYSFKCYGTFRLGWDKENILVYLVRGNYEISIDDQGIISEVRKIEDTPGNDAYWREIMKTKAKIVGEKEYLLENNKIIVKTKDAETVVYDASNVIVLRNVFIAVIVVLVVVVVLYSAMRFIKKNKK